MEPRKRAARILPDGPAFGYGVLVAVILVFLCAFAISLTGQAEMAATYMGLTGPTKYLVPIVIDTSLLVYAAAALVRRARGESVRWAVIATAFWTAVSIGANMVHALQPDSAFVGAALATLAPLAILMSSLTIESLLVAPPAVGAKLDREANLAADLEAERALHAANVAAGVMEADQMKALIGKLEVANSKLHAAATSPTATHRPSTAAVKALAVVPDLTATVDKADREARVLELKAEGATNPAIVAETGISLSTVKRILSAAKTSAA